MEERLTSGRTVWVQDPALKEDKVFFTNHFIHLLIGQNRFDGLANS